MTLDAHYLRGRRALALALQSRVAEVFAVDIHPAAAIGKGILLDHATDVLPPLPFLIFSPCGGDGGRRRLFPRRGGGARQQGTAARNALVELEQAERPAAGHGDCGEREEDERDGRERE